MNICGLIFCFTVAACIRIYGVDENDTRSRVCTVMIDCRFKHDDYANKVHGPKSDGEVKEFNEYTGINSFIS